MLVWKKVPDADYYVIYRAYDGGKWKVLKTTQKTSYSDSMIRRGSEYWYKVRAVKKNRNSCVSLYSPWITTSNYAWVP